MTRADSADGTSSQFTQRVNYAPDPVIQPEFFNRLIASRVRAFLYDLMIVIGMIIGAGAVLAVLGIVTLGLAWGGFSLLVPAVALTYFTMTLGGPDSATWGMRREGIVMRTWDGHKPGYVQALVQTLAFYVTVSLFTLLVLLVPFFNARRRCLHDFICGTLVVNARPRYA